MTGTRLTTPLRKKVDRAVEWIQKKKCMIMDDLRWMGVDRTEDVVFGWHGIVKDDDNGPNTMVNVSSD